MQIKGLVKKDPNLNKDSIFLIYNNGNKNLEVRISPYFGSNIYKYEYNGFDIFYSNLRLLKKRGWTGCFILWPLPNRVRNKKFKFEGKIYDLSAIKRKSGNFPLIHGLVDDKVWQIGTIKIHKNYVQASTFIEVLPSSEIFKFFPFKSRLTLTFTLSGWGLKVNYQNNNLSESNLPFGFALHPYFTHKSNARIFLAATSLMEKNNDLLPTGKLLNVKNTPYDLNSPVPLSYLSLDDVFTNIDRTKTPYVDYPVSKLKIFLKSSQEFTHAVIYTGEKSSFCFENQTGATDMINLHAKGIKENNPEMIKAAHLMILPPNQQHAGFVFYKIKQY